jgi:two-component system LytT family response regulator
MDGMELAALLARMTDPPVVVFVTAYEEHAASAYRIGAVDYLLKPVSAERLAAALTRVRRFAAAEADPVPVRAPVDALAAVPVELGGRTRYVRRDDVRFVEAQGDYVRLHTPSGAHLVRIPLSRLEEHWRPAGFSRVHRSYLLAVPAVRELRSDLSGGLLAHTDVGDVPVSRRHARELREHLMEAAARGEFDTGPDRGRRR